jgi:uncharacterized protein (UPF0147 family)
MAYFNFDESTLKSSSDEETRTQKLLAKLDEVINDDKLARNLRKAQKEKEKRERDERKRRAHKDSRNDLDNLQNLQNRGRESVRSKIYTPDDLSMNSMSLTENRRKSSADNLSIAEQFMLDRELKRKANLDRVNVKTINKSHSGNNVTGNIAGNSNAPDMAARLHGQRHTGSSSRIEDGFDILEPFIKGTIAQWTKWLRHFERVVVLRSTDRNMGWGHFLCKKLVGDIANLTRQWYSDGMPYVNIAANVTDYVAMNNVADEQTPVEQFQKATMKVDETIPLFACRLKALFDECYEEDVSTQRILTNKFLSGLPLGLSVNLTRKIEEEELKTGAKKDWQTIVRWAAFSSQSYAATIKSTGQSKVHEATGPQKIKVKNQNDHIQSQGYAETLVDMSNKFNEANFEDQNGAPSAPPLCFYCNYPGHRALECWRRLGATCLVCGGMDHDTAACPKRRPRSVRKKFICCSLDGKTKPIYDCYNCTIDKCKKH